MVFSHRVINNKLIVRLHGDINIFDVPVIRKMLEDFSTFQELTFDLSNVSFIDSAFVNLLLKIREENPGTPKTIQLLHPNEFIYETLLMLNLETRFTIIPEKQVARKITQLKMPAK